MTITPSEAQAMLASGMIELLYRRAEHLRCFITSTDSERFADCLDETATALKSALETIISMGAELEAVKAVCNILDATDEVCPRHGHSHATLTKGPST